MRFVNADGRAALLVTGAPAGVGTTRTTPQCRQPVDEVLTRIDGVGEMRHSCVAGR